MSDIETPQQIVTSGSIPPYFSLAQLLMGAKHIAPKVLPPEPDRNPRIGQMERMLEHYGTIKRMLLKFASNREIGEVIGYSHETVSEWIGKFPELKRLSLERQSQQRKMANLKRWGKRKC